MCSVSTIVSVQNLNFSVRTQHRFCFVSSHFSTGYRAISGDKLRFHPATGNGLVDGVLELYLANATNGTDKSIVDGWVMEELTNGINFPLDEVDHYIYVMPPNVDFGSAAAYACLWCPKTVYYDLIASNYEALLHEVGHNLGTPLLLICTADVIFSLNCDKCSYFH